MTMTQAASTTMTRQQGLTDLEARFIAYLDAKPRTIDTYRKALKQFFTYLADNGITRPERTTIIAYRDSLLAEKKPTTVQTYMVTVRLFFRWAAQEGLYPNVADKVKGAKLDKAHKKDALTANQARTILQAIDRGTLAGKRDYAILALMMGGGLRTIEVSRANLEDLGTAGGSAALYIQGKGRDEKTDYVKLPQPVEAAIRDYLKARGKAEARKPCSPAPATTTQDRPLQPAA